MTSIRCPECSTEITTAAHACPRCNFPISKLRGLSAAILTRNGERVAGLIQLGADVNAIDNNGRTPLITASLMDDEEIVQMLLAAGAKPEFASRTGETALSVAKSRDVERLIRRAIVVSKHKRTQTAPIEDSPQSHKVQVQERPATEFDDSVMFTEIPPPQFDHAAPIDVQLNEELFESLQSHRVAEEKLPATVFNEVLEWENRKDDPLWLEQTQPFENKVVDEIDPAIDTNVPFKLPRTGTSRYFVLAMIGCLLLIVFMAITWPRYSPAVLPQPKQNPTPIKQVTRITPAAPVIKKEIVVPEKPEVVEPIPVLQVKKKLSTSSRKQKPEEDDEQKIRLARALNNQGFSLLQQGRHGEAIPVLERSVRSFPKGTKDEYYAYALFNLGVAWRRAGRPDLAIPILEERMKIANQRDIVARELSTARKQAKEEGFQE